MTAQHALSEQQFAYHATSPKHLPSVLKHGLSPTEQEHPDEDRGVEGRALFFSSTPQHARVWGKHVVKFPWPEDAEEDPYGDTMLTKEGRLMRTNWYSERHVPPEHLQQMHGA